MIIAVACVPKDLQSTEKMEGCSVEEKVQSVIPPLPLRLPQRPSCDVDYICNFMSFSATLALEAPKFKIKRQKVPVAD